jgi:hypothetical protein
MDDSRLPPPDRVLRVMLLPAPLLNYVRLARPEAPGCASCGRPWPTHSAPVDPLPCDRCGSVAALECFRRPTAITPAEVAWRVALLDVSQAEAGARRGAIAAELATIATRERRLLDALVDSDGTAETIPGAAAR